MNNKGLAISGVIYTILVIMLVMMSMMLFNLQNRKTILDTLKTDSIDAVEKINNIDYLLERIQMLEQKNETLENKIISMGEIYPVGSIYISMDDKNPSSLFGGTWKVIGEGRTLVGNNGTSYKTGATGGVSSVTLLTKNLPEHTHSIPSLSGTTNPYGSGYSIGYTYSNRVTTSGNSMFYRKVNAHGWGRAPNHVTGYDGYNGYEDFNDSQYPGANHTHSYSDYYVSSISGVASHAHGFTTPSSTTGPSGNGESFSVQNPYIVVYMWQRTA